MNARLCTCAALAFVLIVSFENFKLMRGLQPAPVRQTQGRLILPLQRFGEQLGHVFWPEIRQVANLVPATCA